MSRPLLSLLFPCLLAAAPPKVAVFEAAGFPAVDTLGCSTGLLTEALAGLDVVRCESPTRLRDVLAAGAEVLILPYGSAFPAEAFEAIRSHLARGGHLVNLGGAPLRQPVRLEKGRWIQDPAQATFAHTFLMGPAEALDSTGLQAPSPVPGTGWTRAIPQPTRTWALTVRFGTRKEALAEEAPDAPRDGILRPLVQLSDGTLPRACAVQEIDRLRGAGAGGRWVLATHNAPMDAATVRALVDRALEGAAELEACPLPATVEPGETPRLRVQLFRPAATAHPGPFRIRLLDGKGRPVLEQEVPWSGLSSLAFAEVPLKTKRPLPPGLHRVEVRWGGLTETTGVWVRDGQLLSTGSPLTVSRDWLRLDGKVHPLVGTTYMDSSVHRRFLFQPNPARWDTDFARMKALGVNTLRTGLWAYWNRLMTGPGALDDGALRALDAYVLTAARHQLHVCFTFFAFLPPAFGGENPYLDPKALESQAALLAQVAARYKGSPWIHYDLINEPSWSTPETLWTNRPMGDRFERAAWKAWVEARHGSDPAKLQALWRDGSGDVMGLPTPLELNTTPIKDEKRPRKTRDFRVFTMEAFAGWAGHLRDVLRSTGANPLVTVGQDEAGLNASPSIQVMAERIDYTALHDWWLNDDLLWDHVTAKVPEKPMVVQETGMMRLEDVDGDPWRTPEAAARLLERKFALTLIGRGAGMVQWAWNINPYMALDNESVIGFFRPDGTAKEELRSVPAFSRFLAQAAPHLDDFTPDPVVVVIPHSRMLMGRPQPFDGVRKVLRTLSERFGIVPTALSELRLTPERLKDAKLVLVPGPEWLEPAAADALALAAKRGTRIVFTGALEGDPYGQPLSSLPVPGGIRPLAFRESSPWLPEGWVTFDGQLNEKLRRGGGAPSAIGQPFTFEPLPLELAREEGALAGLLKAALEATGIPAASTGDPMLSRTLETPTVALLVAVNETERDLSRTFTVAGRSHTLQVKAGRSACALVRKADGVVVAAL